MGRPVRNDGEILLGKIKLPNRRDWRALELVDICDRNKHQILAVARRLGLGTMVDPLNTGNPTRIFTTKEVKVLLQWFDENGRRRRGARWRDDAA